MTKTKSLFVPGMKNNAITNERLETYFFKDKEFDLYFDYKSTSVLSDYARMILDSIGITTDAVNRLVKLLDTEKPTHVYAHSHGTLILLNAMSKIQEDTLKNMKEIYGFGGRVLIPNVTRHHEPRVINFFNKKDWVFRAVSKFTRLEQTLEQFQTNTVLKFIDYTVKVSDTPSVIESYDYNQKRNKRKFTLKKRTFNCNTNPSDTHKFACYEKDIRKHLTTKNKHKK